MDDVAGHAVRVYLSSFVKSRERLLLQFPVGNRSLLFFFRLMVKI